MKTLPIMLTALFAAFTLAAQAEIVSEIVEYDHNGAVLEGVAVHDDSVEGKQPGVIIFHQWSGISDYEKARAKMLAEQGYAVFIADIYSKGIRPETIPERQYLTKQYGSNRKVTRERANAALEAFSAREEVDTERIGAIGYCFGGMVALELARSGAPVKAVASIHGSLNTPAPEDAANIKASILIQHGAADPYVPQEELAALKEEMSSADVDFKVIEYADAVHAFTDWNAGDDPSNGAAYNEAADKKSWTDLLSFFDEKL